MKRILLTSILLLAPATVLPGDTQTRLHVTGLTCPSCGYIVATALKRVYTVEIAEFVEGDAQDGVYVLRYDDSVTEPEALIATVTGVGYGAILADGSGS